MFRREYLNWNHGSNEHKCPCVNYGNVINPGLLWAVNSNDSCDRNNNEEWLWILVIILVVGHRKDGYAIVQPFFGKEPLNIDWINDQIIVFPNEAVVNAS